MASATSARLQPKSLPKGFTNTASTGLNSPTWVKLATASTATISQP